MTINVANRLKAWRKRKNLTQQAAAKRLNLPVGTLRGWEYGRRTPSGFTLRALMAATHEGWDVLKMLASAADLLEERVNRIDHNENTERNKRRH